MENIAEATYAFIVDEQGFRTHAELIYDLANKQDNAIIEPIPFGLYKERWNGSEWVEGETLDEKNERESQQLVESLKPSASEISDAELEIKIISMLTEMGVIQ